MSENDETVAVDESKYASMPRVLGAAHRSLDVATQKLANLEARKEKARAKLNKVLEAIDEKRPALVETIARSRVRIAAFETESEAVQAELDKLNGVDAPAEDTATVGGDYADESVSE